MQLQSKKKQKPVQQPLSRQIKQDVLQRWRFSKHNAIPEIAEDFGITKHSIHKIIDNFLSSKIPQ